MSVLLLCVVFWLVISLEETEALRASLKSTLQHDLQLCSDVMRQVKHVLLQALWQRRQDTKQGNWSLPAQPHVQLSPTFSCHMWQTAACRKQALLLRHTNIWIYRFSPHLKWFKTLCGGSFVRSAILRKRAFSLSLMALDKHSYWFQKCLTLKGWLPMVLHLVCLLFYKCHCHILLNLSVSFPPLERVSVLQL